MNPFKSILKLTILCNITYSVEAQNLKYPVIISLFNEATAIPFTKFITIPIHPGLRVGTEFKLKDGKLIKLYQTTNLGYYYHQHLAQSIFIGTETAIEVKLKGWKSAVKIGVAYLHVFRTAQSYKLINEEYVPAPDWGNPRIMPSLSIQTGYFFNSKPLPLEIFIEYQSWMEYPYSPGFIPLMTHINLHVGCKFYLFNK